ncbi:ATP-dependent helicase, partial [Pseudomonas syringae pv. tagetis]
KGISEHHERLAPQSAGPEHTMHYSPTTRPARLREKIPKVLNHPQHLQQNRVIELDSCTRQQIITAEQNVHKEHVQN